MSEQSGRPSQLRGLVPFKPGQSGNPRGRAPDPLLRALKKKLTASEAADLTDVLFEKARDGDMKALEMIWDRIAGKPVAREERGGPGAFSKGFEIRLIRVGNDEHGDETSTA